MERRLKKPREVTTLVEIYETDDGLHYHWIESKEHNQILEDLLKEDRGEIQIYSFQKIIQSPSDLTKTCTEKTSSDWIGELYRHSNLIKDTCRRHKYDESRSI